MVSDRALSFIIQGPVLRKREGSSFSTADCIDSIRARFPASEIVVSTWDTSDVSGLACDTVVRSRDPGATSCVVSGARSYNVNRQIISTSAGLKASTRPYAAKMRGDLLVTGRGFLDRFQCGQPRHPQMRIFCSRILAVSYYARDPRIFPLLFHPSDIFQFGAREDLLKLWDLPLAPEPETARWLEARPRPVPDYRPNELHRYTPEQYIWISCLARHGIDVQMDHPYQLSAGDLARSELSLANNFLFAEPRRLGIRLPGRLRVIDPFSVYGYRDWLLLQRRCCGNGLTLLDQAHQGLRRTIRRILSSTYHSARKGVGLLRARLGEERIPTIMGKSS